MMGNKMSLTEATMLALQGKLVETKLPSKKEAKVEESISVDVDETTNINVDETSISVDETTTVVETPEATIIIEEPKPEIVEPIEEPMVIDTPVEEPKSIEVPVEGNETIIPEEIIEEPVEEIVEPIDEETPEELEESKENDSKCVRLTLDGKIYWEGTEEEFLEDEEGLKLMACDIYEEDTGETRDADEVNVEYVDCLEENDVVVAKSSDEEELRKIQDELRGVDVFALSDEEFEEFKKKAERMHELIDKIYTITNLRESKKLQEEISDETCNIAEKIAEEIRKAGCMSFMDIDAMAIEMLGITMDEYKDSGKDTDLYTCLNINGIGQNFSSGDFYTDEYAKENPAVLEESKLEEVSSEGVYSLHEIIVSELKNIKRLGGYIPGENNGAVAGEYLKTLDDNKLNELAQNLAEDDTNNDIWTAYHEFMFLLEDRVAELAGLTKTSKEESKSLKFNSKSFNEALTKYFKNNYKTVENVQINKVGINNNGIKVEAKLTSVDAKERTICLEMNKVSSAKAFAKYTLKEATGLLKENKQNVDKLTMMTFTNKDNVLECKYLICK